MHPRFGIAQRIQNVSKVQFTFRIGLPDIKLHSCSQVGGEVKPEVFIRAEFAETLEFRICFELSPRVSQESDVIEFIDEGAGIVEEPGATRGPCLYPNWIWRKFIRLILVAVQRAIGNPKRPKSDS